MKKNRILWETKIKKNNIILLNVSSYKDIPFLSNTEALMVTPEETETLQNPRNQSKTGSEFLTIGAWVSTVAEVKNLYSKILIDPYDASADNRIFGV